MIQKPLTAKQRRALPPLGTQDGKGLDATAYVRYFHPATRWTFYATEFDGKDTFFGYCVSTIAVEYDELCYFSLAEMQKMRGPLNLGVERDLHFHPTTVREAVAERFVQDATQVSRHG